MMVAIMNAQGHGGGGSNRLILPQFDLPNIDGQKGVYDVEMKEFGFRAQDKNLGLEPQDQSRKGNGPIDILTESPKNEEQ